MDNMLDFGFENPPPSREPSGFEYATKLLLPALSLVAFIVTQFTVRRATISWVLLGLTILLLVIGFWQSVWKTVGKILNRRRNYETIKRTIPEFRAFVNRFEHFVNSQTNNTVHYIVLHDVFHGRTDQFMALSLPDCEIWHTFWQRLSERADGKRRGIREFERLLKEFNGLLGLYNNYCVVRIFEHSTQEFRNGLTPEAKRSLNSFQQRFSTFLDDYEEFGKKMALSIPLFGNVFFSFSRPRPL